MSCTRREFVAAGVAAVAAGLSGCTPAEDVAERAPEPVLEEEPRLPEQEDPSAAPTVQDEYAALSLDMDAWRYDRESDCYYQLGLTYCLTPASRLEQLAIFVPGRYFVSEGRGPLYSCAINRHGRVGDFTPATAPIVLPINAVRCGPQEPPAAFGAEGLSRYLEAGFVYVYVGLRGRSSTFESNANGIVAGGAPWAVSDLKAAVRYLRYNAGSLPCDAERVFTFGMGGAGGISMVAGASGDAASFTPYLSSIGAAMLDADGDALSDAICGSASWCPITSFDVVDAAYEWECGQFSSEGMRATGTWGALLSHELVGAYADWVNGAGLVDDAGTPLLLDAVGDGSYTAGTYYDHVLSATEQAANAFLSTTQFPYTYAPPSSAVPAFPGNPSLTLTSTDDVDAAIAEASASASLPGVTRVQATVYDSAEAYIEALNASARWLTYNSYWGTVRVSGLWDMARAVRTVTRGVAAFDAPDRSTFANQLFGVIDQTTLHFSRMVSSVVSADAEEFADAGGWEADYPSEWLDDLRRRDAIGSQVGQRVDMMNPLAYVCASYAAYGTGQVAPHWRVNAGLFQTETSLAVVANLAVALAAYGSVSSVAFTPVWGRGFELAEREGEAQDNLVAWVHECCMVS